MKTLLLILTSVAFSINIFAQVAKQWEHSYSYSLMNSGHGVDIVVDNNNTPVVLGMQWGWEQAPLIHIYKISPETGGVIWDRGPANSQGQFIFSDSLNNIFVSGRIKDGFSWKNPFITKYNSSGTQIFYKTETTEPYSLLYSACIDPGSNSYLLTKYLYWFKIQKYDPLGNVSWTTFYEQLNTSFIPGNIKFDKAGNNIIVSGMTIAGAEKYVTLLKFNSAGNLQDTAKILLNSTNDIRFDQIETDNNSNIYLTGLYSESAQFKHYLMKISPSLDLIWLKVTNANTSNNISRFTVQNDSTIIKNNLAGCIKYDSFGNVLWNYNEGKLFGFTTGRDNFIYACGGSSVGSTFFTCKLNQNGTESWSIIEPVPSYTSNSLISIKLDTSQNVYVHGTASYPGVAYKITTIKYSQLTKINSHSNNLPSKTELLQNYPNPFNPYTVLTFNLSRSSNIILTIFDITGKELFRMNQNDVNPGKYSYNWNANSYTSGIYFVRFDSDSYSQTRKMILIK